MIFVSEWGKTSSTWCAWSWMRHWCYAATIASLCSYLYRCGLADGYRIVPAPWQPRVGCSCPPVAAASSVDVLDTTSPLLRPTLATHRSAPWPKFGTRSPTSVLRGRRAAALLPGDKEALVFAAAVASWNTCLLAPPPRSPAYIASAYRRRGCASLRDCGTRRLAAPAWRHRSPYAGSRPSRRASSTGWGRAREGSGATSGDTDKECPLAFRLRRSGQDPNHPAIGRTTSRAGLIRTARR